ncbi:MAG: hypothetical protein IH988_00995 [Planctomycetes bacterium]|nr:hypothetical protein [Planctomycetota bacterium]
MAKLNVVLIVVLLSVPALGQTPTTRHEPSGSASGLQVQRTKPVNAVSALRRVIRKVDFDEVGLVDALDELATAMNINLLVRWRQLEAAGIDADDPVSLSVANMRFGDVLLLVLEAVGVGPDELAYSATPDTIVVSTLADITSQMVVRIYDVKDLTMETVEPSIEVLTEFTYIATLLPVVDQNAVAVQPIIGRIPIGVSLGSDRDFSLDPNSPLFQGNNNQDDDDQPRQPGEPGSIEELVKVIVATVEPQSWQVNGGRGTIIPFNGQLVVRNSIYVHQLIGGPIRLSVSR